MNWIPIMTPSQLSNTSLRRELSELRRSLHRVPEVGLELPQTKQALLDALEGLPVTITQGSTSSWLSVVVEGELPGPTVLLRGDMDALPVVEQSGEEFASVNGAMHACGHDLHMAGLVGAIRILCERRDEIEGRVLAVFQPGEEGYAGAAGMIAEGVLAVAGDHPVASYGLHVFSCLPAGEFSCRPGTIMAGTINFEVEVIGQGGHAARPAGAKNPILVASQIVGAIQAYATQKNRTEDPVIATVGFVTGGTASNVIPERARLGVSVRAMTGERLAEVFREITGLAESIAAGFDQRVEIITGEPLPPTVSSPGQEAFVERTVAGLLGPDRYRELPVAEMISEDFSHFLNATGGAFLFLGASVEPEPGEALAVNHSPFARFDDSVVADGAAVLAELALERLRSEG